MGKGGWISVWSRKIIQCQELAELIQKGLRTKKVIESREYFFANFNDKFHVCALGIAIVGKIGSADEAYNIVETNEKIHCELEEKGRIVACSYVDIATQLLKIEASLANSINKSHVRGMSALAIAQKLWQGTFPR
jgi:hypothetical protein